ncbi:DUF3825 domain-containing protein [Frigoribacterium sp. CFBP 13707]|uniref:DUF3825 domain-containing protein n=1 Tax=Frigoribacterium sp. CFBP 13707 TaxID=2775313 RepID=UPI00177BDD42|nr:DUF3825 domain-containing protein [Frigoribacterium sp. CFBP 13707]MBD8729377.1 DUF3825 domain-containing protein [Frigoribacterium sp. CFBP 13707]
MSNIPTPGDVARRVVVEPGPAEIGPVTEGHADGLRAFAFFSYKGPRLDPGSADFGRLAWEGALTSLAELAEPEEWSGYNPDGRPLPILDSFLRYTHRRLVMEDKIAVSEDGMYAATNTGLLTSHAEEIFGLFERNNHEGQRWFFLNWVTESHRDILRHFGEPPHMAEYVTSASELVYDWRRELKLAYDHILGDNLDRFPAEMVQQPLRARQALDASINSTLRRVRRNHKLVIPQWYPKLGEAGAQFLMPLDLTGNGTADLALVVSAVGDRAYRGHTVLTLDMAYTNARLVARPDSDWLAPSAAPLPSTDQAPAGFEAAPADS